MDYQQWSSVEITVTSYIKQNNLQKSNILLQFRQNKIFLRFQICLVIFINLIDRYVLNRVDMCVKSVYKEQTNRKIKFRASISCAFC